MSKGRPGASRALASESRSQRMDSRLFPYAEDYRFLAWICVTNRKRRALHPQTLP